MADNHYNKNTFIKAIVPLSSVLAQYLFYFDDFR